MSNGSQPIDRETAAALHNRLAPRIAAEIMEEPMAAGGTMSDVMMLLESIMVGIALGCIPPDGDATILDAIVGRAKDRIARARLADIETAGSA
jgi:hypothetical protein